MRNRVFGVIGILWGGGALISFFIRDKGIGNGAYWAGTITGLLLAAVMFGAGVYALTKKEVVKKESASDRKKEETIE